jgi:hypothetical protein
VKFGVRARIALVGRARMAFREAMMAIETSREWMRGFLTPSPAIEFGCDSKFKFRPMSPNNRLVKSGGRDRINFKPVEFSFSLNARPLDSSNT